MSARREAEESAGHSGRMAGMKGRTAMGAGIFSEPTAACSKGGASRSPVCQEDYCSNDHSQG